MPRIDIRELKTALLGGAVAGLIIGLCISGTVSASDAGARNAAATSSCGRTVCESTMWLRAPVRYRPGGR
ncbi:MAG: hypothetical protein ACM31O_19265 [Bacteroidota bacterium]|jgi:hypothetical protein